MSSTGLERVLVLTAVLASACGGSVAPSPSTGLTGVVVRGPVAPVCEATMPCEVPFSARFTVQQDGRQIAQFQSDTEGRFTVALFPGTYRVVPDKDAPLMAPASQARTVTVGEAGLTTVRLQFDTGIR